MVQRQHKSRVRKLVLASGTMGVWPIDSLGLLSSLQNQWVSLNWQFAKFTERQNFLEMFVKSVDPTPDILILKTGVGPRNLHFYPTTPRSWGGKNWASLPGLEVAAKALRALEFSFDSRKVHFISEKLIICHTVYFLGFQNQHFRFSVYFQKFAA